MGELWECNFEEYIPPQYLEEVHEPCDPPLVHAEEPLGPDRQQGPGDYRDQSVNGGPQVLVRELDQVQDQQTHPGPLRRLQRTVLEEILKLTSFYRSIAIVILSEKFTITPFILLLHTFTNCHLPF